MTGRISMPAGRSGLSRPDGAAAGSVPAIERRRPDHRPDDRPARARLLSAARSLVAERGYEATTVVELCRAAGLSRQTFYTYFDGKHACVAASCDPALAEIDERVRAAGRDGRPWAKAILGAIDHALGDLFDSPETPRGRLLRAMIALAAEKGYAGTTIGAIAKAAHVGRSDFYLQFDDKLACLAAAHGTLLADLDRRLRRARAGATGSDQLVIASVAALARFLADDPAAARVLVIEGRLLAARRRGGAERESESLADALSRCLAECSNGRLTSAMSRLAAGAVLETVRAEIEADRTGGLPHLVPELASMVLRSLQGVDLAREDPANARDPVVVGP